jgi:hypothetical protein
MYGRDPAKACGGSRGDDGRSDPSRATIACAATAAAFDVVLDSYANLHGSGAPDRAATASADLPEVPACSLPVMDE